jgi:hypothetical protein
LGKSNESVCNQNRLHCLYHGAKKKKKKKDEDSRRKRRSVNYMRRVNIPI